MQLKQLYDDSDAVSPVIGVILMVAITVILAAVIGAFVLNLGGSQAAAPSATLTCNSGDLVHDGGDELVKDEISFSGSNTSDGTFQTGAAPWTAGDKLIVDYTGGDLIWNNPNSDSSQVLRDETCPQP